MFSRRAPMQPENPMMNITRPMRMKNNAGSRAKFVNLLMLLNVSFSIHAHNPMANIAAPINWNVVLSLEINNW